MVVAEAPADAEADAEASASTSASTPADAIVDVDVALDNMNGREFADLVNRHLALQGSSEINVGMVLANPEKSKHLETATMKVGRFWVDFVNLRAESYASDSRIPSGVRIGTPEEDAFRRDLTINSLFYNLASNEIEDLTGRGLSDLRAGVIDTPLPPETTFLDDPLRVLRAVRFAARLQFVLSPRLRAAASSEEVREALAEKVSRERVGGEVDLMMRSLDPVGAMRLIASTLDLGPVVFPLPASLPPETRQAAYDRGLDVLAAAHDYLTSRCPPRAPLHSPLGFCEPPPSRHPPGDVRRLLWYAAFLSPFRELDAALPPPPAPGRGKARRERPLAEEALFGSLKRPARDAADVLRVQEAAAGFSRLLEGGGDLSATAVLLADVEVERDGGTGFGGGGRVNGKEVDGETRSDPIWRHAMELRAAIAAILIRAGPLWRAGFVLSLSERLADLPSLVPTGDLELLQEAEEREIGRYDALAAALVKLELERVWEEPPLVDGGQIMRLLGAVPKGPGFKQVVDAGRQWQLMHPEGTRAELEAWLKAEFPAFL
ncbi:hypothetical protein TeGR_g7787 [Tetraparma gracilis]|uniref:Poly A polymerase head domain-containing protein n=1 Tax=Tetraparma gracilis TaxID=2962635 RepID=A0ABQ6M4M2_9STRA|nr:hypothetical protein TeGR_g7787 [Tetraparma gracilis]